MSFPYFCRIVLVCNLLVRFHEVLIPDWLILKMLCAWTGLLLVSYDSLRIVRISEWIFSCKLYIVSWSFTRLPRIAIEARGVYPWRKLRRYGSLLGGNVVSTYDSVLFRAEDAPGLFCYSQWWLLQPVVVSEIWLMSSSNNSRQLHTF